MHRPVRPQARYYKGTCANFILQPSDNREPMRQWLARLAFSFLVVGVVLGWQTFRILRGELRGLSTEQTVLVMAGALCALVVGVIGIRERHRNG
jgi:hypothetical protein